MTDYASDNRTMSAQKVSKYGTPKINKNDCFKLNHSLILDFVYAHRAG